MYILIEPSELVATGFASSLGREGVPLARFLPAEFLDWVSAAPSEDLKSVEAFLVGNCEAPEQLSKLIRSHSPAPVIAMSETPSLERALALLEDAARAEPRVLTDPSLSPRAFVAALGDFGIDLELGVWIADPEGGQLGLRSAIHRRILRTFAEAGIEIPFPIREVRIVGAVAPDAPKP